MLFVNHFAAERGWRWWIERTMAPAARVLGWHPDFMLSDLLPPGCEPDRAEACPPIGLFTLVRVRRG
jgi:phosphatidylethanolamine/phosphatidyl-N-methylethanolamine N-methyltransferase